MGLWLNHHKSSCVAGTSGWLVDTAGAASLSGAAGWSLTTEVWHRSMVLGGK